MAFLVLGNLLFLAFCIPPFIFLLVGEVFFSLGIACFSVIPAFSGLLHFVAKIIQNKKPAMRDFFLGVYRFYGRSIVLGSLGIFSFSWLLSVFPYGEEGLSLAEVCLFVLSLFSFLFLVILSVYAVPIMVFWDLTLKKALIQALILTSHYRIPTAGILSLGFLVALLAWWTKLGLLIILPSVWAVFLCKLVVKLSQDLAFSDSE
ncbi:MAG: hypothetical protein H5U36_05845 [Candidatus Caldatribacterium sp.]|nr:hypothetical protein [Candidatus Caldatribacterium sp.]